MAMARASALTFALGIVVASAHCGSNGETPLIVETDGGDGGTAGEDATVAVTSDAGSTATCGSIGAGCTGPTECCVNACNNSACGGPATGDAGTVKICNGAGGVCARGFDCCSGTCNGGKCVGSTLGGTVDGGLGGADGGTLVCNDVAATCKVSGDCCSGRCEPVTGQAGVIKCRDACRANGQACVTAQDCCSLGCFNNQCGANLCTKIGDACANNQQCCSGVCDQDTDKCVVDVANSTCRPTGESCGSGPQSGCCGRTDSNDLCVDGRCAAPPAACKGQKATCATDAECCGKHCDPTSKTCATACKPTSGACVTGADCCAASCTNGSCDAPVPPPPPGGGGTPSGDGATGTPPGTPLCKSTGTGCAASAECCSSLCLAGFCDTPVK